MNVWNGYTLTGAIFLFVCRHCQHKIRKSYSNVSELKSIRTEWREHVDDHGGPYA